MIDIEALKNALQPLGTRGVPEVKFEFNGTVVVLMPLRPLDEVAVQRYAAEVVLDDDESDNASGVEYLDRFKFGCLGYSIQQVGDLDLRGLEHVETGETLPNGVAVKVPKEKALRGIISEWPRPIIDALFKKFTEMMERFEVHADKMVEYNPVDHHAEISRLEEKIDRLKGLQVTRAMGLGPAAQAKKQVRQPKPPKPKVVPQDDPEEAEELETAPDPGPDLVSEAPAPGARRSILPVSAPPPVHQEPEERPLAEFAEVEKEPAPERGPEPDAEPPKPSNPGFIDKDDDGASGALEEEAARLMAIRREAGMKTAAEAAESSKRIRPAPHLEAAEAARDLAVQPSEEVPVFQPPTQEITGRRPPEKKAKQGKSTKNPKFRPPGR
jgi:hypothetical protein